MATIPQLSRLSSLDVRDVWPHEAHHFTQWLLQNADVLSDVLGMDLELTQAEKPVGGFSLDLIGKDLQSGATVIVENQLATTDHSHLGQLLTYAGGTDPSTVVWCAPAFREEHRAALDWLNEHTDEGIRFFGVEISAVRIGDSAPAPLFRLVANPNDWAKRVHSQKAASQASASPRSEAYEAFWTYLLKRIHEEHPAWTSARTPSRDSWMTLPFGASEIWYAFAFASPSRPRIELYFGSPDADRNEAAFKVFESRRQDLEAGFGEPLDFQPLEGKKASRIVAWGPTTHTIMDPAQHPQVAAWFIETMARFRQVTQAFKSATAQPPTASGVSGVRHGGRLVH
jgi:hypothetical protein